MPLFTLISMPTQVSQAIQLIKNPRFAIPLIALSFGLTAMFFVRWFLDNWIIAAVVGLGLVLIFLVVALLWALLSTEKRDRRERGIGEEGLAAQTSGTEVRRASLIDLQETFSRGVAELRKSKLSGDFYALPWLLVIGERGSGKTALVQASGLEIPAEYSRVRSLEPTTHLEWCFSNQAIVLDTAGRYLAADDGGAHKEWRRLLKMLRQARPQLALNGIVLTVSAPALLDQDSGATEEAARRLRRRLNEIEDTLGVEAPIYLVVTKSDQIEGFVDFANGLPPAATAEAFGWTNDERRFADAGELVEQAVEEVRARLDSFVPELLMRDPDPLRRRRIFGLPQELVEVGHALAAFVGRSFGPTVYGETPFLRGIYFASALREGQTVSPLMRRLGQPWVSTALDATGSSRGLFLRDTFREVIAGDVDLALPASRLGPRVRRLLQGTAIAGLLFWLGTWGYASWQSFGAIGRLSNEVKTADVAAPTIQMVDRLRQGVDRETERSFWQRAGLGGTVDYALERAQRWFVFDFGRNFEEPTKARLLGAVRVFDDRAFDAVAELARDVSWMASRASGDPEMRPRLAAYSPAHRSEADTAAYDASYDAWLRWAPDVEVGQQLDREREALAAVAHQLLNVRNLERWSVERGVVRYQDLGLPDPEAGVRDDVPAAYTREVWASVVAVLLRGVESTGGAAAETLDQFQRDYIARYDASWLRFLRGAPMDAIEDPRVMTSPYLSLVESIDTNTSVELPRQGKAPGWLTTLREARRVEKREEEPTEAPWVRYQAALAQVDADAGVAELDSAAAYDIALLAAKGEDNAFQTALDVVDDIVPTRHDPVGAVAIRNVLEQPILNGLSAVLASAQREIDRLWEIRIASRYSGKLSRTDLRQLYGPGGDLEKFKTDVLGPFVDQDERPRRILTREMPLSMSFLDWLGHAEEFGDSPAGGGGGGGPTTVRLDGVPSRVLRGGPAFVTRRVLSLDCPHAIETFVYKEGTGSHAFNWSPNCGDVILRVWVRGSDGGERELMPQKTWSGPLAFQTFLRQGRSAGANKRVWNLNYAQSGLQVAVTYRLSSDAKDLIKQTHRAPPGATGE